MLQTPITPSPSVSNARDGCTIDGLALGESASLQGTETSFPPPTEFGSTSTKMLKDPYSIELRMRQHGLFQGDKAYDKYPELQKQALGIINGNRDSAMKPSELSEYRKTYNAYKGHNERTYLSRIVPLIQKSKYHVKKELGTKQQEDLNRTLKIYADDEETRAAIEEMQLYSTVMWIDDGLLITEDSEFGREMASNIMPNVYPSLGFDATLAKAMAKEEGMKNPKPDYTYGIDPGNFPVPSDVTLASATEALLRLSPGMVHPLFFLEGKSDRGRQGDAENQACRGGGTLVAADRMLRQQSGADIRSPGADMDTYLFSGTFSVGSIRLWLHWAEVLDDGTVRYHMNKLISKVTDEDNDIIYMSKAIQNILSWGLHTRKPALIELHQKLHEKRRWETAIAAQQSKESARKKRKVSTSPTKGR